MKNNILVTGGSRGIGAAIYLKLAAAQYQVGVNYRQDKASEEQVALKIQENKKSHAYPFLATSNRRPSYSNP